MRNIEKIRQEIDRRYEENREKARYDDYYRGMNDGLDSFESFLDTLQEEKPIEKDMKLVFKKNPAIQVTAPKIKIVELGNYGWYEVENCTDSKYEKILAPFSMAFWDLVEK